MRSPRMAITTLALVAGSMAFASAAGAQSIPAATQDGLVSQLETVSGYILTAAEQVAEDDYSFQPTPEVRTFGELVDHVADAHFGYCTAIGGGERPSAAGAEAMSKSQIVRRFRAAREYCLDVYRNADPASLAESIDVFGSESTRVWTMIQNVTHDNLHYGNVVTYMRSLGMVPPSSQA